MRVKLPVLVLGGVLLLLSSGSLRAEAPVAARRVLILNPHSRDVEPHAAVVSAFRAALARELGSPVQIHEISLDLGSGEGPDRESALVGFIEDRLNREPTDLVVPVGSAGLQFVERHRARLSGGRAFLAVGPEARTVPPTFLRPDTAVVGIRADLSGFVRDILQLKPGTKRIAVVLGSSPVETYWAAECRTAFAQFEGRVEFRWLNERSFDAMIAECSALPPDSFILHLIFLEDATGVACEKNEALRHLHRTANAPVYSCYESELGMGGVGGHLLENSRLGKRAAEVAARILRGEQAGSIPAEFLPEPRPVFDWRELRRWGIPETRLPQGSEIRFREPGFWDRYRWIVMGATGVGLVQSALIVGLVANRRRRIRGEREAALLADISSRFVNLPAADVDREILDAQERICRLLDLDLSVLWQLDGGVGDDFIATHAYHRVAPPGPLPPFRQEDFPWVRGEMLAGRRVVLSKTLEMPSHAARDRESVSRIGIRSTVTLPLSVGGAPPFGVLSFNALRREHSWPPTSVSRLELVAQIFSNALARKRSDEALRESQLRLGLATESAGAGLWVFDCATGEFWVNAMARTIFGYSPDERIDLARFETSVVPVDWPRVQSAMSAALETGAPVDIEYRLLDSGSGEEKWIVSRGRPVFRADGSPDRLVGLSLDVTTRRKSAAEIAQLRTALAHSDRVGLLGHLASALAHELSQPLGAILRNTEAAELLLTQSPLDLEELRAILEDILRDDHRAGDVIDRLRSLLKRGTLDPCPVHLPTLVSEVLPLIQPDATHRRVRIETDIPADLPMAMGDRIHLQQVLINLIVNAMDALDLTDTPERLVRVQARLRGPSELEIEVSDTGPGLADAALPRLFDAFFTTKPKGMGIGLPVSKTIIEAHKGRLWAANRPEGGARFCFTLPVADRSIPPPPAP